MPEIYASKGLKRILRWTYIVLGVTVLIVTIVAAVTHIARPDQPARRGDMHYATAQLAATAFIAKYEERHGHVEADLDSWLINQATRDCQLFGNGYTVPDIWDLNVRDGMSSDQSATVIDLAVEVYCPQYHHLLQGQVPAR